MSQKNKNIFLIIAFVFLVIIAYQLAFSKTIEVKKDLIKIENEALSVEEITALSFNINEREKFLDSILKKNNIKNTSIQNNLLEFLNKGASEKKYIIKEFKEPHIFTKDGVKTTSYQLTISGNFNELLQVIYALEQDYNFGVISHINFEKKRDYRKRKKYLDCFVVIESYVSN